MRWQLIIGMKESVIWRLKREREKREREKEKER